MKNTLNPCGCDGGGGGIQITTSDVTYNGAAEPCIPINAGDNLTTILQKIGAIICDLRQEFGDYYTSAEIDALLAQYAKLQDLLSSGEVVGKNIVFSNAEGQIFSVDASAFLAQGVTLTYVNGTLALLDADGNQLSSVDIAESSAVTIKSVVEVTGPLTINWSGTVPEGGQTFAEKHGNHIHFQGYYEQGGFDVAYMPSARITRDGGGEITQVEFGDVFAGTIVII